MTAQGVLITGVYGTGKSSVAEEIAELLEEAGDNYGAIDLDWLQWFDADVDETKRTAIYMANLSAVAGNYVDAGVERLVLAGAIRDAATLEAIRAAVPATLRVVRLSAPYATIETRLGSAITAGRANDLRVAAEWLDAGIGVGFEDITMPNDRPVRETALEVLDWLGWWSPTG